MALPVRRLAIPILMLVVAGALIARARLGLDLGDGTHAVELAMRLARGDQPFRDEMNLQVLGAWPAVPFVWGWLHVVGVSGVVLASRVFFVVLTLAVAALAWRAVARSLGRLTSGVAAVAAVVPTAYNLQLVGYNTTPALLYLVAASSAVGAIARGSLPETPETAAGASGAAEMSGRPQSAVRWAVLGGAAAVLGAVSHPVTAPAGAALLLLSLGWSRGRVRAGLTAGAAGAALVVAGLAGWLWGLDHVRETLAFTADYQGERVDRLTRLEAWLAYLGGELTHPAVLVALGLGVAAAVALWRRSVVAGPLLLAAVALTAAHGLTRDAAAATFSVGSWLSPVLALVLTLVLLPAAIVTAALLRGAALRLLTIGAAPTVIGAPVIAAFTSSSPTWGAVGACLAPAVFAVTASALTGLTRLRAPVTRAPAAPRVSSRHVTGWTAAGVGAVVLVALVASHTATSFRDGPLGRLDTAAPQGAYAGLLTTDRRAAEVGVAQAALRSCATAGSSVLAIGYPAAYLMGDVRSATPVTWLGDFGPSTSHVVQWLDERQVVPDCVVRPAGWWRAGGGASAPAGDPLRAWVEARYSPSASTSTLVVLRRNAG
ncbi:hypothetical protein [Humibacillus xanthopallidus]|uniref:hypothetical protein n=1 Tax=Humibacillus xanthopallidus TaxID=412689 RepID=UPI00384D795D